MDILRLMAEGLSIKEIAFLLEMNEETVKINTFNIYGKLQVNRRVQVISKSKGIAALD